MIVLYLFKLHRTEHFTDWTSLTWLNIIMVIWFQSRVQLPQKMKLALKVVKRDSHFVSVILYLVHCYPLIHGLAQCDGINRAVISMLGARANLSWAP